MNTHWPRSSSGRVIKEWDPQPVSFTMSGSPSVRVEPITLATVKKQQKLPSSTSEDELLTGWIAAAREWFEEETGRQIITATYEYALDQAPHWPVIQIPRPPLIDVDSVIYEDGDGNLVTVDPSTYVVHKSGIYDGSPLSGVLDPYCERGSIEVASGSAWPTTSGRARSLRIRFVCGYGATVDDVPASIKALLYELVAHYARNRSEVTSETLYQIPLGAGTMMQKFKYRALQTVVPRCW